MPRYKLSTTGRRARFTSPGALRSAIISTASDIPGPIESVRRRLNAADGKQKIMISAPNAGYIGDTLAP